MTANTLSESYLLEILVLLHFKNKSVNKCEPYWQNKAKWFLKLVANSDFIFNTGLDLSLNKICESNNNKHFDIYLQTLPGFVEKLLSNIENEEMYRQHGYILMWAIESLEKLKNTITNKKIFYEKEYNVNKIIYVHNESILIKKIYSYKNFFIKNLEVYDYAKKEIIKYPTTLTYNNIKITMTENIDHLKFIDYLTQPNQDFNYRNLNTTIFEEYLALYEIISI